MRYYTCFYRHKDNSGKIIGYTLRSEESLEWMEVTPEQLKFAMQNKTVTVFNLKLTSDNRIIETPNNESIDMSHFTQPVKEEAISLSNVKIVNDDEKLDYTKDNIRSQTLKRRVPYDGVFSNKTGAFGKIFNMFSRNQAGVTKKDHFQTGIKGRGNRKGVSDGYEEASATHGEGFGGYGIGDGDGFGDD